MRRRGRYLAWGLALRVFISTLVITLVTLTLSGCGKLRKIAGIGDFDVHVADGVLNAGIELTRFETDTGLTLPVPRLDDAYIELGANPNTGGSIVRLLVPMSSIAKAVEDGSLPVRGLPDGRRLYGTTNGALPSFDLEADALHVRFYVSRDVFGAFLAIPLPRFGSTPIEFPIKDKRGYVVGYGFAVPPGRNGRGSGLLLFFSSTVLLQAQNT